MMCKKRHSSKAMFLSITLIALLLASPLQLVYCQKTVEIGVIAPNGIDEYAAIISIANDDINDYMASKSLDYRFTYILEDAQGNPALHLEHVQKFRSMGINLLIGGGWSSQAQASLSYINNNEMLLFSSSSTGESLSIPNDNLFRLALLERWHNLAEVDAMWSWGIDAAIVLYPNIDAHYYDQVVNDFMAKGGKAIQGHDFEPGTSEFHDVISRVEADATELADVFGSEHVGLLLLTSNSQDLQNIIRVAVNFPTIINLIWFSRLSKQGLQNVIGTLPSEAEHLKLFSVEQYFPDTSKAKEVEDRFVSLIGMPFTWHTANLYDICWIYALSIFTTDSVDAITIKKVLPDIAAGYNGVTGNCELDENGDRVPYIFDIWGSGEIEESIQPVKYAYYDFSIQDTVWDNSLITPIRDGVTPVNIPPFAVINGPYSGQEDSPISFSSAGSNDPDGNIVEYNWNFGDGNTATGANPSHTYMNAGTYTITLTVRDNLGAINVATTQCTVNVPTPTNQAPVAAVNGPYSGEEDSSISFSSVGSHDPDGNIVEYRWNFGDEQTSTSVNPSHTYEEAGTYTVTLSVTDDQGAIDIATTSCTVEAAPKGGFPWLPILVAVVAVVAAAAFFYLQKMKPRVKVRKPVEFDIGIEPKEIPADGRSTAIITIGLLDDTGRPFEAMEDMAVIISASGGVVVSSSEVKKDEVTGATTITDSLKQAIEGLLSRREEAGMRISIKQGEMSAEAAIVSSLEVGDVTLSFSGPGMKRRTLSMRFSEKRRYCMHCGASMSISDRVCPKCGLMPPSGVDVKSCPNCGEVIPSVARFCSECGAGQPVQQ